MKQYQLVGLNWLVLMHKQKLNGILADEMVKFNYTLIILYMLIEDNASLVLIDPFFPSRQAKDHTPPPPKYTTAFVDLNLDSSKNIAI